MFAAATAAREALDSRGIELTWADIQAAVDAALLAEAEWLDRAHANSAGKGYSREYREGFKAASGWVRFHGHPTR